MKTKLKILVAQKEITMSSFILNLLIKALKEEGIVFDVKELAESSELVELVELAVTPKEKVKKRKKTN
jgi:hypothetical protein